MQQQDKHQVMQHDCCDEELTQQKVNCCDTESCDMLDCASASCSSYSGSLIAHELERLSNPGNALLLFIAAIPPISNIEHPYRPPMV